MSTASKRVDAPRALPGSRLSFGSLSSPSPSGSAAARRGPLQGVLETPVTFPSRAVRSVKEESRQGRSTMRTASFCKTALSLFVHPGFIGSPSACHQSGGFPATGPSAQRHFSSVQRWTTSRCGSGRRCLAVGCLCSHFAPRAFSLFALGSLALFFLCAKSRVKHFRLTLVDFFLVIDSGSSQLAFLTSKQEQRGEFRRPCRPRHDRTLSQTFCQSCTTALESRELRAKVGAARIVARARSTQDSARTSRT